MDRSRVPLHHRKPCSQAGKASAALEPALPLRRALAPEGDTMQVQGRPVHAAAWAKRFLLGLLVPGRPTSVRQARSS